MNRAQLKYLAIAAMLLDHIAWAFVPTASLLGQFLHFVGRLTAPVMAYFIAEGYFHTRNVKKYALRLGLFSLLSWPPFVYFEFGRLPIFYAQGNWHIIYYTGVIYTLFLGLLAIWLWDRGRCPTWCKVLGVLALCLLSLNGDWMCINVLWCLFFFIYRDRPKQKWIAFCLIGLLCFDTLLSCEPWWRDLFMLGIFLAPPILQFAYNGQPGSQSAVGKWFFYLFYPLHLLALGILRWVIL